MSDFSNVDASASVERLVDYLDRTDRSMAALKAYMAFAARRSVGTGVVADLGCGVGHDLARLRAVGLGAVGLDASAAMLVGARRNAPGVAVAQADVARLPLRDSSVDGCRVERVLQHVESPAAVVAEMARVVRPGGFVAVFEPDYSTFRVTSDLVPAGTVPARLLRARHPTVGRDLPVLLEASGFVIEDVVTESSRGYAYDRLPIDADAVVTRARVDGRMGEALASAWTAEQRARTAAGTFRARWDKILVVARRASS